MKKIFLLPLLFLILAIFASAEETCEIEESCAVTYEESIGASEVGDSMAQNPNAICIIYFYTTGCPKCAEIKPFIEGLEKKYGNEINIHKLEVSHNIENYQLYNKYCSVQNIPLEDRGVPMIAVNNKFFMGPSNIEKNLESEIQELLKSGFRVCPLPGEMGCSEVEVKPGDVNPVASTKKVTLPLVLGAGLIDGINPCAFAVLIFLLTFLLEISSTKKRMVKAGSVYILAVYITYLLAGLGLLTVIQISGVSSIIVKAAAVFALFAGLVNVKDYFWYGKGFSLEIPKSKKGVIEGWTKKANIPAAIVLGFLVSMFELPCTGGVYLAILAMLANTMTKTAALGYLLVYNLMFVLPLVAILILVTKGMKAEHIENWRSAKKNWMRLVLGLFLLALGIGLLLGWL
ncbi:MAG: cytochrome c biogenesis protein CcdA [Nanoarchaeota archaeon]|nr:cytochrome c biogenesis protein CcdA [Nanoarchaeota archaeon]